METKDSINSTLKENRENTKKYNIITDHHFSEIECPVTIDKKTLFKLPVRRDNGKTTKWLEIAFYRDAE